MQKKIAKIITYNMKYIKKSPFKLEKSPKFKSGDLVTIKNDNNFKSFFLNNYAEVTHVYKNNFCEIKYRNVNEKDICELYKSDLGFHKDFNVENNNYDMIGMFHQDDLRKLSDLDIENINLNRLTNKYNL